MLPRSGPVWGAALDRCRGWGSRPTWARRPRGPAGRRPRGPGPGGDGAGELAWATVGAGGSAVAGVPRRVRAVWATRGMSVSATSWRCRRAVAARAGSPLPSHSPSSVTAPMRMPGCGLSRPARSDSGKGAGVTTGPAGLRASRIRPSAPYSHRCGVWAAPAAWTWSKT